MFTTPRALILGLILALTLTASTPSALADATTLGVAISTTSVTPTSATLTVVISTPHAEPLPFYLFLPLDPARGAYDLTGLPSGCALEIHGVMRCDGTVSAQASATLTLAVTTVRPRDCSLALEAWVFVLLAEPRVHGAVAYPCLAPAYLPLMVTG